MMLGTIFVEDPDKANWWLGALFGGFHGIVALTVIVPLLPGMVYGTLLGLFLTTGP